MQTNYFKYQEEKAQNPYIGFTSFQHFRGEALYSDIVVKPENNMRETENVEPYPVPDYVPQNGREEGYYPDLPLHIFEFYGRNSNRYRGNTIMK